MSNNLITIPTANPGIVTSAEELGNAIYIAPKRFDVHAIEGFLRWADTALAAGQHLVLDLRVVDFMDHHMKTVLDETADRANAVHLRLTLRELSPAAALTFDLLNRAAA